MKYVYLPAAQDDVDRLHAFLNDKDPAAAANAIRAIAKSGARLLDNPKLGRPVASRSGMRQLVVPFGRGAYILHYRLTDDAIFVTRIWHSREDRGAP